jgi:hypothetical protein
MFHSQMHVYHCGNVRKCHLLEMLISEGFSQQKNSKSCPGTFMVGHLMEEAGTNNTMSPAHTTHAFPVCPFHVTAKEEGS